MIRIPSRTTVAVALAALSLLAGCSSKEDVDKPAELTDFTEHGQGC